MASFNIAQELVKRAEGKYSTEVRDPGNYTSGKAGVGAFVGTNWGVSAPVLKAYLKREPTAQDMKALTYDTALRIYKSDYWDKIAGDKIKNQTLANILYDGIINQGSGTINKVLTDSLGVKVKKVDDNIVGLINKANPARLFEKIKANRIKHYDKTSYAYSSWMDRINKIGGFAKRNWVGITLTGLAIAGIVYFAIKNKSVIINKIN